MVLQILHVKLKCIDVFIYNRNVAQNDSLNAMDISVDSSTTDHRSRLTNIIDHLVIAQKRAESSGNVAATTFVNEQLKRYTNSCGSLNLTFLTNNIYIIFIQYIMSCYIVMY